MVRGYKSTHRGVFSEMKSGPREEGQQAQAEGCASCRKSVVELANAEPALALMS